MSNVPMLKPREAAQMLGISYPTIKQWILAGKLKTVPTQGGHHRITLASLKPYMAKDKQKAAVEQRDRLHRPSARNQLVGRVVDVRVDGLLAQVILVVGDQRVTSIITADAAREMQLKKGDVAAALVKATDVMIERVDE